MRAATKTDAAPAHATPFLKWAGGKRRLAATIGDHVWAILCEKGGRYFEPFLGGGALALHLGWPHMVLSDFEEALIETYTCVVSATDQVTAILGELNARTDRDSFEMIRAAEPTDPIDRAARFIYLNRIAFNGLYRVNASGKFNVPYGRHTRPPSMPISAIQRAAEVLKGASFKACDFEETIAVAGAGDVIYADPPYDGTYQSYTAAGFTAEDQERLAMCLYEAAGRGAVVMASNRDTEVIRVLYAWADITPASENHAIAARGSSRGQVPCVMITSREG